MGRVRSLVAHALVATAIFAASIVAVAASVPLGRPSGAPPADARATAGPSLSSAGRLAYWRLSPVEELELWVSELDGPRRWVVATAPKDASVDLTRWSPDGSAVAFAIDGAVRVARLDGARATITLPAELEAERWRPVVLEWSPGATRIAATFRPASGASSESDVLMATLDRSAATWTRRTTTGDALAGPWLDDERLLVETAAGAIGVLAATGEGPTRPITAMPAVSPRIGTDGRVYFFGGRGAGPGMFSGPLAAGTVWSSTIDGDEVRREAAADRDQGRLQAFLGDGRFVIGVPGAFYVVGDEAVPFPWRTGTVRRVVVSQDGRRVIGLTETRIVRVDASKIPRSGEPPADATAVLLDGARAADAWFPSRPVALARVPARPAGAPGADLAFTFARSLWHLPAGGEPRPLVSAPAKGWVGMTVPSPRGDLLAAVVSVPSDGYPPRTTVVIVDRDGRWRTAIGAGSPYSPSTLSWSPDGTQLALSTWSPVDGFAVQLYDTATWSPGMRYDGMRGGWTARGLVLVDNGRVLPGEQGRGMARVGQSIELLSGSSRRVVTDADRLAVHPLLRVVPGSDQTSISQVLPSADGRHLAVWLTRINATTSYTGQIFVVVDLESGEPIDVVLPFAPFRAGIGDVAWSPAGDRYGWTRSTFETSGSQASRTAVVRDVAGRTVLERDGRFAGWSPDGDWIYVARNDGLFAVRLDGSSEVRVSALGVAPVVATRP